MASDPRFDQLKLARDLARERQNAAWTEQDRAFKVYQRVRDNNSPRLDQLKHASEREAAAMHQAFARSQAAFQARQRGLPGQYSAQGRSHRANLEAMNAESKRLRAEISTAGDRHRTAKATFQAAKASYASAKRAFEDYREQLTRDRRSRDVAIAAQAGAPAHSRVTQDPITGNYQVYFDGSGIDPLGAGHAHYVTGPDGRQIYQRDPSKPHGAHNFVDHEAPAKRTPRQRQTPTTSDHGPAVDHRHRKHRPKTPTPPTTPAEHALRIAAYEQWRDSTTVPPNMWIEEKDGRSRDRGEPVTDVYIGFKGERDPKRKIHIQIDMRGEIQYVRYLDGDDLYNRKRGIGSLKDLGL